LSQQLKALEWARAAAKNGSDPLLSKIDLTIGTGIAGHSMGGQATLFSSAYGTKDHDIKAAVMHHA
jgi:hypothetical protein